MSSILLVLCSENFFIKLNQMAKIKFFDLKSQKNRERVRKHREKRRNKLLYEQKVQARREQLYPTLDVGVPTSFEHSGNQIEFDEMSDFIDKLKFWAVNNRITAKAISELLVLLIGIGFTSLPKDSRTFMRTPTNIPIAVLSQGRMWYKGLTQCLEKLFLNIQKSISITLNFNFDGLPLFKSSNSEFWPILASIKGKLFYRF